MHAEISIRHCHGVAEFETCVALQKEVWDFSDYDLCPPSLFVVAEESGGQVIGAFEEDRLIGFALSFPGTRLGKPYLHSHLLAVHKDRRNAGVGVRLKLFQRADALAQGFDLIEWTFDPLEIKNANLNIEKLGAVARRYRHNLYGFSSSCLHGVLPTDRLIAEWWLRSPRVEALLSNRRRPQQPVEMTITVPAEIHSWRTATKTRHKAEQLQTCNRELFRDAFARGLTVIGYERDTTGGGIFQLAQWNVE